MTALTVWGREHKLAQRGGARPRTHAPFWFGESAQRDQWRVVDRMNRLFAGRELRKVLEHQERQMLEQIGAYPEEKLLNTSLEDLATYFAEEYRIPPIRLRDEEIHVDQREVQIDVSQDFNRVIFDRSQPFYRPGREVTLFVPFDGEPDLFDCVASTRSYNPPQGRVRDSALELSSRRTDHDADAVKAELDGGLDRVRQHLAWIENDLIPFNALLLTKARRAIDERRERLLRDRDLVAELGYPLKKRNDAAATYTAPEVRRKIRQPPAASTEPYRPEPTLSNDDYEHVLEILTLTASVLERSPQTFARMGEEELRDQFLVPLNSHYEGQATGETFNASGKTDILIRVKNRPIFVAECKIWRGGKAFLDAIDQLLSYTTWRDTKTAILLFNKNKDLSRVLAQIQELLAEHDHHKRRATYGHETAFRAIFGYPTDANRELVVTVLVFDVPESGDSNRDADGESEGI